MIALRIILALDLGVTGAGVILHDGVPVDFFDMPCLNDGPAGRRSINAALLAELVLKSHASGAFVEAVGPRPGEGAVGAFAFGRAKGLTEGFPGRSRNPGDLAHAADLETDRRHSAWKGRRKGRRPVRSDPPLA